MITSDFIPVRSGSCLMKLSLSPVRIPARPLCNAPAAPEVTRAPYPCGNFSICAIRFPAATSSAGMLTKWRVACAITASTSGRPSDPPSTVIVPSALMTVGTPSSSYGFPDCPKPASFGDDSAAFAPHILRGKASDAASDATIPKNPRRLELSFILRSSLFFGQCCDTIDFHQRVSRKGCNRNRGAGRAAMREIRFENFVHSVIVVNLGEENAELNNVVHVRTAGL